ncbi:DUF1877 family protein [Streptomyces sp. NPDC005930]|uniref:DUF1877 family protein n=1 Tax=Streptomyces sp. NPDC005930 TaxID=3364736 RepID=UPI0036B8E187
MSVSFFWRRASAEVVSSLAPQDLLGLVPDWGEEQELWDTGLVAGVEFHCSVMHRILLECSPAQSEAVELPVYGGEPRKDLWTNPDGEVQEYTVVTVLAPEAVAAAAEVLSGAQYEGWIVANPQRMTAMVKELGFSTSWDDDWARSVIGDLQDLADFYRAAARAGDAMVKYLSC